MIYSKLYFNKRCNIIDIIIYKYKINYLSLQEKNKMAKRELELKYRTILKQQLIKGSITRRTYNREIKELKKDPIKPYWTTTFS